MTAGGCLCGACRWEAKGTPKYRMVCHCRSCRVGVGSNGVPWATFEHGQFELTGETVTDFESSSGVTRTFCGRCGTSLTYVNATRPGEVDVTQGTLDDPDALGVEGRIWLEDAAAWERRAHALPTHPTAGRVDGPPLARPLRTWVSPKVAKGRPSPIAGRGAFATEAIAAGEVVEVKAGHILSRAELEALPDALQESEIGIAPGLHLAATTAAELDDVMLFLNHSCEPNVGVRGNVVFVAMRDIAAGEELTIDYAMIDDHDDPPMRCRCGADSCRHEITGSDWQRPELQHRYGSFLSAYLLHQIAETAR